MVVDADLETMFSADKLVRVFHRQTLFSHF
jgi:hypothetical protein